MSQYPAATIIVIGLVGVFVWAKTGDRLKGQPRNEGEYGENRTTRVKRATFYIGVMAMIGLAVAFDRGIVALGGLLSGVLSPLVPEDLTHVLGVLAGLDV